MIGKDKTQKVQYSRFISIFKKLTVIAMKLSLKIIVFFILISCNSFTSKNDKRNILMPYNEQEILTELDLAFNGTPSDKFPKGKPEDIIYNFFLDLEHGYCETAGSKIHLFVDSTRWAIVFEKSGYQNRAGQAEIELTYIGNCIDYPIDSYPDRNYISNVSNIILIDGEEFEQIENKDGEEMETFELIGHTVKEIKVRDQYVPFDNDYKNYEKLGIDVRAYDNPKKLIGFGELIRYFNETNPEIISATEDDIREHIPNDIPKLMTIKDFHFSSAYDKDTPPSKIETYKLIAKILTTKEISHWKPTLEPNNSWKNWESGNL